MLISTMLHNNDNNTHNNHNIKNNYNNNNNNNNNDNNNNNNTNTNRSEDISFLYHEVSMTQLFNVMPFKLAISL